MSLSANSDELLARPGQTLAAHCENVAAQASRFGSKFGAGELLRIAGLLHDIGKASPEFQAYLKASMAGENTRRGEIRHSIYGAKKAYESACLAPPAAELIGNSIASHHGVLRDHLSPEGDTPLLDSLAAISEVPEFRGFSDLNVDAAAMQAELTAAYASSTDKDKSFSISMFERMVFSCLVDADRLDAYLSETGEVYREEAPVWGDFLERLECRLAEFTAESEMARLRARVSEACAKAGSREPGVYKLEVPTGGGKTLASLRFALEHARRHGLDRIIYVIPYLSITSQTAQEIRCTLNANADIVLEHHSNFFTGNPDTENLEDEKNWKLHTDRWDAPIILTTQVQFLESVFSARGSDLRKLHNMARSVIVFDEAQSLPIKCIHLFNGAINFLHRVCGSTILLCTATQPLLDKVERPLLFSEKNPSIADCGAPPKRYELVDSRRKGGYSHADLAAFVMEKHISSTLVIVNTKSAAKALFEELTLLGAPALHLSTNMCPAHRDAVIAELRRRLDTKEPAVCVSTQLIEAGVDISLECVIRDIAGLDSIYQAAGRCNRHGEFGEPKNVYIVNVAREDLSKLPDIKLGREITERLFDDQNIDINSIDIDEYYRHYFYAQRKQMYYPITGGNGTIYDLLSSNTLGRGAYCLRKDKQVPGIKAPALLPALRSAADAFFVIDRGRIDVVVPYGESEELLSHFCSAENISEKRRLLRKLGKYSVSLYQYQCDSLNRRAALNDHDGLTVLVRGFYNAERGVDLDGNHEFLNV